MGNVFVRSILAMLICASMAACGTSKDSGAPVHVGKPGTQAKTDKISKDQTGRVPSEKDLQDEQNQLDPKTQADAAADSQSKENAPAGGLNAGSAKQGKLKKVEKSATQKSAQKSTTKRSNQSAKAKKKNPIATTDISDATIERLKAESDRFTGAASDYLRNLLVMKAAGESRDQQARDLQVASRVRNASLDMNADQPGRAIVTLTVTDGRQQKQIQLKAEMSHGRGRLAPTKSIEAVKGEIICMDQDEMSCHTAVADLIVNDRVNSAKLRIIFRNTAMHVHADFPNKSCMTQGCQDIYTLFSRTEDYDNGNLTSDRLAMKHDSRMESFEVINGRSGFRMVLHTLGQDVIAFGGPLYSRQLMQSSSSNVEADRTITMRDQVNYDGLNYTTYLNNELTDVRIIDNDGLGNVTVTVTTAGLRNNLQDQFQLTIQRKSPALRGMVGMDLAAGSQ